jgi:hypothetical protein
MKKILVIPVMLIYILAVSGVWVNAHYCGGQLESWDVFSSSGGCSDDDCSEEEETPEGCCSEKMISSKLSLDQQYPEVQKIVRIAVLESPFQIEFNILPKISSGNCPVSLCYFPKAPPGLWQQISLYKLHSGFIFYG